LVKETADESNPENVRIIGSIILKNFIANKGSVIFQQIIISHIGSKILRFLG